MGCGVEVPLAICRGKTFRKVFRWGQTRKTYKPIIAATVAAPCVIEVTAHGLKNGWPYQIANARGMTELNTGKRHISAIVVDPNHLEINELDASALSAYAGGGILSYSTPVDLTGMTGRAKVRKSVDSVDVEVSLVEGAGITTDPVENTITMTISAADTAALDFIEGVYDLEMVTSGGDVEQVAYGPVTEEKEVTR